MPNAQDLLLGAKALAKLKPRWCHSGPDLDKDWAPKVMNTAHGDVVVANSFARWVMKGGQLEDRPYMNCWEAIFYAAFLSGCVSLLKLRDLHENAASEGSIFGGNAYYAHLMTCLHYDRSVEQSANYNAPAGAIVFIENAQEPFKHVMLCTGGPQQAWSNDVSDFDRSGQSFEDKQHFKRVNIFRHLNPPLAPNYVGRWASFPF